MHTLQTIFFILFFIVILIVFFKAVCMLIYGRPYIADSGFDEEVETVTTTTTVTYHDDMVVRPIGEPNFTTPFIEEHPTRSYVGTLKIQYAEGNSQPFVYDPVDNLKWFLNESDDQYEDAEGKMWRLVK